MAVTSTTLELGTPAPSFVLPDVRTRENVRREDFTDAGAVLVMFLCTHCPYVKHVEDELAKLGQLDASRPRNDEPVTGADLRAAIDSVLAGEPVPADQKPSMGCGIKWKLGNQPGA